MLNLTPQGIAAAQQAQVDGLDPLLVGTTTEQLARAIVGAFDMTDYYEAGGKEPRRTARRRAVVETRSKLVEDLQDPKHPRIMIEAIFHEATRRMVEASVALKERRENGQALAIPYAKRVPRRKSRSVSGT